MTRQRITALTCLGLLVALSFASPSDAARRRLAGGGPRRPGPRRRLERPSARWRSPTSRGRAARPLATGVAQALGRRATVIKPGAFEQTAAQLGVKPDDPAGMVAVCGKLKCDARDQGRGAESRPALHGERHRLQRRHRRGARARRQAGAPGPRRLAAAGAAAGAQCLALVAQAKYRGGGAPRPPPARARSRGRRSLLRARSGEGSRLQASPRGCGGGSEAARQREGEGGEGGEEEEGVSKRASPHGYAGLFEASFALGISTRSVQIR